MVCLPPRDMKTEMFTSSTTTVDGCYIHCLVTVRRDSLVFMLIGLGLIKAVRAVTFSPASTLLAAAGDSRIIALYDVRSGEQVANLSGHAAWVISLDFSSTGEWLLSGFVPINTPIFFRPLVLTVFNSSYDGKIKVWGMETRSCVATHGESDKPIWSVKWIPKQGRGEQFVAAGAGRSISFYREASGG
jgi:superkiller protein 8